MPSKGEPAPDFTAPTQTGTNISLSDFRGHKVVLYFYPKDFTFGCTKQACSLRDSHDKLTERGVVVLGVSAGTEESKQKFAEKHELPFLLLADEDLAIVKAFGVFSKRKILGKTFAMIKRTTFLIDEEGVIFHKFLRPKLGMHGDQVLAKIPA